MLKVEGYDMWQYNENVVLSYPLNMDGTYREDYGHCFIVAVNMVFPRNTFDTILNDVRKYEHNCVSQEKNNAKGGTIETFMEKVVGEQMVMCNHNLLFQDMQKESNKGHYIVALMDSETKGFHITALLDGVEYGTAPSSDLKVCGYWRIR